MKHISSYTLMILLLPLIFSCQSGMKKQHLARIDSLKTILDTADAQMALFDNKENKEKSQRCIRNFDQIREHFSWNLKDESWNAVMAYGNMTKTLKKLFNKSLDLKKQILESRKQLSDLGTDISNASIPKEKQQEYLNTEDDIIKQLALTVILKTNQTQLLLSQYDSLSAPVQKLLDQPAQNKKNGPIRIEKEEDD